MGPYQVPKTTSNQGSFHTMAQHQASKAHSNLNLDGNQSRGVGHFSPIIARTNYVISIIKNDALVCERAMFKYSSSS